MREIKYRLRSPLNQIVGYEKWYQGSMDSKNFYVAEPCWLYSVDGKFWNPKKIEHRQKDAFTDLSDKSGREIYEGDICRIRTVNDEGQFVDEWSTCKVWFSKGQYITDYYGFPLHSWCREGKSEIEVVGNIYENPEALKEGGGI